MLGRLRDLPPWERSSELGEGFLSQALVTMVVVCLFMREGKIERCGVQCSKAKPSPEMILFGS